MVETETKLHQTFGAVLQEHLQPVGIEVIKVIEGLSKLCFMKRAMMMDIIIPELLME